MGQKLKQATVAVSTSAEWLRTAVGEPLASARALANEELVVVRAVLPDRSVVLVEVHTPDGKRRRRPRCFVTRQIDGRPVRSEHLPLASAFTHAQAFERIRWLLGLFHDNAPAHSYRPTPADMERELAIVALRREQPPDAASRDRLTGCVTPLVRQVGEYLDVVQGRWATTFRAAEGAQSRPPWLAAILLGVSGDLAAVDRLDRKGPATCLDNLSGVVLKQLGFTDQALDCFLRGAALLPANERADLTLAIAELLFAAGRSHEGVQRARQAALLRPGDISFQRRVAATQCRFGALDDAFVLLGELARGDSADLAAIADYARLLLFAGRADEARPYIERLCNDTPESLETLRLAGILAMLDGEHERAMARFARVLEASPRDAEACAWVAEIKLRSGDLHGAEQSLLVARSNAEGPIHLVLGALIHSVDDGELSEELRAVMRTAQPSLDLDAAPVHDIETVRRELAPKVLAVFGGNRSDLPTRLTDEGPTPERPAGLELIHLPERDPVLSSRTASAELTKRVGLASEAWLMREFQALIEKYPTSPHPFCYRGEVRLWLGQYDAAFADFDAALSVSQARWGYVGRAAVHVLRGEYDRAHEQVELCHRHFPPIPGATTGVYLGEMYRRQGDLERALKHLGESVAAKPGRVAAWMNIALIQLERGEVEPARAILEKLTARTPRLLWDAAQSLRPEAPWPLDVTSLARVFEVSLAMMRGNRSSHRVTYFDSGGTLRIAEDGELWATLCWKHRHYILKEFEREFAT